MGIASVVLGILGILLSWLTCLWPVVAVHVVIGLALGIADVVTKSSAAKNKPIGDEQVRGSRIGVGIAGICLNCSAVVLAITWQLFWQTHGFGTFK